MSLIESLLGGIALASSFNKKEEGRRGRRNWQSRKNRRTFFTGCLGSRAGLSIDIDVLFT